MDVVVVSLYRRVNRGLEKEGDSFEVVELYGVAWGLVFLILEFRVLFSDGTCLLVKLGCFRLLFVWFRDIVVL